MSALYIGLMSGTSLDGVDAIVADLSNSPSLIGHLFQPFDTVLQQQLQNLLQPGNNEIDRMLEADIHLAQTYAIAVQTLLQQHSLTPAQIHAIGCHGQTIRHRPDTSNPTTLQIGDPNTLAELTGISVVADLRRRDMAAGGQGAPLVPAFHAAMLRHAQQNRVVVNIGGIANITLLPADTSQPVTGFDTGPGNCLMNEWIHAHQELAFDEQGQWASQGQVDQVLLDRMLSDEYFARPSPKSTGREYFHMDWLNKHLTGNSIADVDVQTSLAELTAVSISNAISHSNSRIDEILVCGGGVHNRHLMQRLTALNTMPVVSTQNYGVDPDWVEAMAFAWLAQCRIENKPGNLPTVTGAQHPVILGAIYSV